jgi:hypothetical protein
MSSASLRLVIAIVPLLVILPALGGARCAGTAVKEVQSLSALPSELRRLLPKQPQGLDGIADRGERFNVTDVVVRDLRMRRFMLAAIGDNCVVIAIERGGRGHYFELTEYRLIEGSWRSIDDAKVEKEPTSIDDLLNSLGWPK